MKEQIREQAQASLYYLCKAVLGYRDLTPELHLPIANLIQDPSIKRLLLVIPRGHFKTSIGTVGYTIWSLIRNPNERIMINSSTATNAERMLGEVKAQFESNELLRWAFPELIPNFNDRQVLWNSQSINIIRSNTYKDPSVDTAGVGAKVAGRHCTIKIGDDLVGEQAAESLEEMQKVLNWFELSESLLENPKENIDRQICTRWHFTSDVAAYIMAKDSRYVKVIRSAIEDGQPIFPQRFALDTLEEMRERKPKIFAMQYMNHPMAEEDLIFKPEWLKYYGVGAEGTLVPEDGSGEVDVSKLTRYLRLDPALSTDPAACRSAFIVDGVDTKNRIFLLEVVAKRADPPALLEMLFNLIEKWKPHVFGMEEVLFQRVFKMWFLRECARRGIHIPTRQLKTSTKISKDQRISGVSHYFQGGAVYIRRSENKFLEEYTTFPLGETKDILDAFSYGPQMWTKPVVEPRGPLPELSLHLDEGSRQYWDAYNRKKLGIEKPSMEEVLGGEAEAPIEELFL
jgi:predicted phage terminase large subunit-like protein